MFKTAMDAPFFRQSKIPVTASPTSTSERSFAVAARSSVVEGELGVMVGTPPVGASLTLARLTDTVALVAEAAPADVTWYVKESVRFSVPSWV